MYNKMKKEKIKKHKTGEVFLPIKDLFIPARTAEVHRHKILKKLRLKNTASLISFINNNDIIL